MLAAAGSGERLGTGGPKAFVALAGRPMIDWSLPALAGSDRVTRIVIAAPPRNLTEAEEALERAAPGVEGVVVAGGATRPESVRAALARVETPLVAIHDAARPLITPAIVDAVLARLDAEPDAQGAILAARVVDTVKRVDRLAPPGLPGPAPRIQATMARELLWAAQTPQAFRTDALREAQIDASDAGDLERATDEAWLIERTGGTVLLEQAPAINLKVTTPGDLALAELLISSRDED